MPDIHEAIERAREAQARNPQTIPTQLQLDWRHNMSRNALITCILTTKPIGRVGDALEAAALKATGNA